MKDFELPTNIRQIGSIDDGLRIYVEDYACTYLKQIADSGGHSEKIAYLVGKHLVIDSQETIFISGVILGKYSENIDGTEQFTQRSWEYAEEMLSAYFEDYEIVGWMQSQPGYGVLLNPAYASYHMENFPKPYQTLFIMDPVERLNAFYAWDAELSGIYESKGYIIYYNKNSGMQDYMLDNKVVSLKASLKPPITKPLKMERRIADEQEGIAPSSNSAPKKEPRYSSSARSFAHEKVSLEYKRVINMLVSLSAVLFIICFIMGAGLIQSDGRITKLEKSLAALDTTSNFLVGQVKQIGAQSVFADQTEQTPQIAAQQTEIPLTLSTPAPDSGGTPTPTATPTPSPRATPTPTPRPTQTPTATSTPTATATPADETEYQTYTVQEGDSLYYISTKFFGNVERVDDIMKLNDITDPDMIFFGKVLKLPSK